MQRTFILIGVSWALIVPSLTFAQEKTWDGECGDTKWDCGDNWDPDGAPEANDNVTLEPDDPTIEIARSTSAEANQVTIGSGLIIDTANPVTFHGTSQIANLLAGENVTVRLFANASFVLVGNGFISGIMDGSGVFENLQEATISGTLLSTFENRGNMTIPARDLTLNTDATLRNFGTIELPGTSDIKRGFSGINRLVNGGTIRKTAGSTSVISAVFTQTGGRIQVQQGTLRIDGAFTLAGGTASVSIDGTLEFGGNPGPPREFAGFSGFTGEGFVDFDAEITVTQSFNNSLAGGLAVSRDLTLVSVDLDNSGLLVMSSAAVKGTGGLLNSSGGTIETFLSPVAFARLLNFGTIDQLRSNSITIGPRNLDNKSAGQWNISGGDINDAGGKIVNEGTITLNNSGGGGITRFKVPLDMKPSGKLIVEGNRTAEITAGGVWDSKNITLEGSDSFLVIRGDRLRTTGPVKVRGSGFLKINGTRDATILSISVPWSVDVNSELNSGIISGPSVLLNRFTMRLKGATFGLTGGVTNGAVLMIENPTKVLGVIDNENLACHEGGTLDLGETGRIFNRVQYFARSGSIVGTSANAFFRNEGVFISGSARGQFVVNCRFDNRTRVHAKTTNILFQNAEANVVQITDGVLTGGTWITDPPPGTGKIIFQGVTITEIGELVGTVGDEATLPFLKDVRTNRGEVTVDGPLELNHSEGLSNEGNIINKGKLDTNEGDIDNGVDADLTGSTGSNLQGACDCQAVGYFTPLLLSRGQVTPGDHDAAGCFCLTGDYDQRPTGMLNIELNGLVPIEEHDQLIVNGDVSLSGSIRIVPIGAFQPQPGDEFEVIQVSNGTVTGTFDTVVGPGQYDLIYLADMVKAVVVTIPGDDDGDGDLDIDDHAAFVACMTGPDGGVNEGCQTFDFEGDDDVDLADWDAFQIRFTGSG